jgi:hypothetical protein
VNVLDYGALGDGHTDDLAAINKAIAAAGNGGRVHFPGQHNYVHSGLIVANSVNLFGDGASTTLTASDPTNGAIELTGTGSSVSQMVVGYGAPVASGGSIPQRAAIWISGNGATVDQVTVSNASDSGIVAILSNNCTITNDLISNVSYLCLLIQGCNTVLVDNNSIQPTQTSGPAEFRVDTSSGTTYCQNVTFTRNTFNRGIVLMTHLLAGRFDNNSVTNGGFELIGNLSGNIAPSSNLEFLGNTFNASSFYGNIYILGDPVGPGGTLQVANNTFTGLRRFDNQSGSFYMVEDPSITTGWGKIQITNNTFTNAELKPIYMYYVWNVNISSNTIDTISDVGMQLGSCINLVVDGNTIKNTMGSAIYEGLDSQTSHAGTYDISGNTISNACTQTGSNAVDVIYCGYAGNGTYKSFTVTNNNYLGPANQAQNYIEVDVPSSACGSRTITGNITSTTLPNLIVP